MSLSVSTSKTSIEFRIAERMQLRRFLSSCLNSVPAPRLRSSTTAPSSARSRKP